MKTLESHYEKMSVSGKSMYPILLPGDYIIIRPILFELVSLGDIIVYKFPILDSAPNVHRVIGAFKIGLNPFLLTLGEQGFNLSVVRKKDLIGIAVAKIRANEIVDLKADISPLRYYLNFRFVISGIKLIGVFIYTILRR